MCFECFLWLKNVVSAIYFCFFHLCRWAVVWPTGWLIYSYLDTSICIILIASTYSPLFFSLFNDFLYTPFIESKSSFVEGFSTSNDNKLQIEWHYFGLLKVLLKLSTNSKHSARLSVSFRKSTVPNWVLDIFVNSLTIRNKSFARVYWSKSPIRKYMWFGSFVQVLKDQKDILPCPYLENMQKIKAAWKDTWMFSQCSVQVSVAQCCNQLIEIHTRPV